MVTTTWSQNAGMSSDTEADNLQEYAEQAEDSKDAAAASASAAASSATSAASSSSAASTSAAAAATSATEAETSNTNAATSATNAATSATNAATSETNAATSATNAATSATNAATSETNASTSATAASTAQTAAEAAQAAAEAAQEAIDGLYLGALASNPTVDGNGDPVTVGDWYFNTTTSQSYVYNGSTWDTVSPDLVADTTPQLGGTLDTNGNNITFGDNDKAIFGDGSDLQIYHDGSHSYIQDTGTGDLRITAQNFNVRNANNNANIINGLDGGSVFLYHNGNTRFSTSSTGVDVTGTVTADDATIQTLSPDLNVVADGDGFPSLKIKRQNGVTKTDQSFYMRMFTGGDLGFVNETASDRNVMAFTTDSDVKFYDSTGTGTGMRWDQSANHLYFPDGNKATFGTGSDLQIYHDGSNSYVQDAGTGNLFVQASNVLWLRDASGTAYFSGTSGNEVALYHNGSEKLRTTSTGIDVTGNATFDDNGKAVFGYSGDLQIYHNGTDSIIKDDGTGDLILSGNNLSLRNADASEVYLAAFQNGEVSLRYDNSIKLATTANGIAVTGSVDFGDWTITESGGSLYFATGGTNKMKLDASGNLDVVGSVNANATIT